MRFGVLGQVVVNSSEREIPLNGWKQTVLLGMLLSHANSAVPAGDLIDALWGVSPPASAGTTLRWHVHQLRKALAGQSRIARERSGYTLAVHDGELDAERFERLAAEGRRRLDESDPERASALLHQALALWRGAAYADLVCRLDRTSVHDVAERLDELRLSAYYHQVEADLLLGRHAALVGQLSDLVAEHPLREGFRAQLMLALCQSGRQAEALETFRQGRQVLAEELGIGPGPELQRLEQEILANQDGWLARPRAEPRLTAAPPPPDPVVPAELPIDPPGFTGRVADIKQLLRQFSEGGSAVVVFGPGGIGKSALAVHVGRQLAESFPDGQLYVNLRGSTPGLQPLDPREALRRFLRSLGATAPQPADSSVDELAGSYRSATAGKRLLVVLDDAAGAAQIWPLLPGSASCAVIITSRRPLSGGMPHHRLSPMPKAEATELLTRLIGDDRTTGAAGTIAEIAGLCDRLPLALCVTGSRLVAHRTWPLERLAVRLRDQRRRLDELADGDRAVRASFAVSYQDLHRTPDSLGLAARRLFRLSGLLDVPDFSLATAAALAGLAPQPAEAALDLLVDAQLAENDLPGRYRLHDLLRLFARELAAVEETEADRSAALLRVFRQYARLAREASTVVRPMSALWIGTDPATAEPPGRTFTGLSEAIEWTQAEFATFELVAAQAAATPGDGPALAVGLAAALVSPLGAAGLGARQRTLSDIAGAAARSTGDPGQLAVAAYMRGLVVHSEDPAEAAEQLCTAHQLWSAAGNRYAEALALQHLGTSYGTLRRFAESLDCLTRALRIFREIDNLDGVATTQEHLGLAYRRLGRKAEAIAAYRRGLELARRLGDRVIEAICAANLAATTQFFGDLDDAVPAYEEALELCREVGHRFAEAECLWGLAEIHGKRGEPDRRRELLTHSTGLLRALDFIDERGQAAILESADPPVPLGFWTNI